MNRVGRDRVIGIATSIHSEWSGYRIPVWARFSAPI